MCSTINTGITSTKKKEKKEKGNTNNNNNNNNKKKSIEKAKQTNKQTRKTVF